MLSWRDEAAASLGLEPTAVLAEDAAVSLVYTKVTDQVALQAVANPGADTVELAGLIQAWKTIHIGEALGGGAAVEEKLVLPAGVVTPGDDAAALVA